MDGVSLKNRAPRPARHQSQQNFVGPVQSGRGCGSERQPACCRHSLQDLLRGWCTALGISCASPQQAHHASAMAQVNFLYPRAVHSAEGERTAEVIWLCCHVAAQMVWVRHDGRKPIDDLAGCLRAGVYRSSTDNCASRLTTRRSNTGTAVVGSGRRN